MNLFKNNSIEKEKYKLFIDKINEIEENFRNKERKQTHKDWYVFKRKIRKWITPVGTFTLNLTMYETKINGVRKTFTYYHHSIFEQLSKSKYETSWLENLIKMKLSNQKIKNIFQTSPSRQLINYHMKKSDIVKQINNQNSRLLKIMEEKFMKNKDKEIHIETDDLFFKAIENKNIQKTRARQFVIHQDIFNKNTQNKNSDKAIIAVYFLKNIDTPLNSKNDNVFIEKTLFDKLEEMKIKEPIIKGDGAKYIKTIINNKKLNSCLDKFHIFMKINNLLGHRKSSKLENKRFFRNFLDLETNQKWHTVLNEVFRNKDKKYSDYLAIKKRLLKQCKDDQVPPNILKDIKSLFLYLDSNKNSIWTSGNLIEQKSFTEYFVYNAFKKHAKHKEAALSMKGLIIRVMYQNLLNNIPTIIF